MSPRMPRGLLHPPAFVSVHPMFIGSCDARIAVNA